MMESLTMQKEFHMLGLILLLCLWVCGVTASVSYDHKALVIDGQRRILISGSIHYPRSTPEVHSFHSTTSIQTLVFVFFFLSKLLLSFLFYLFILQIDPSMNQNYVYVCCYLATTLNYVIYFT